MLDSLTVRVLSLSLLLLCGNAFRTSAQDLNWKRQDALGIVNVNNLAVRPDGGVVVVYSNELFAQNMLRPPGSSVWVVNHIFDYQPVRCALYMSNGEFIGIGSNGTVYTYFDSSSVWQSNPATALERTFTSGAFLLRDTTYLTTTNGFARAVVTARFTVTYGLTDSDFHGCLYSAAVDESETIVAGAVDTIFTSTTMGRSWHVHSLLGINDTITSLFKRGNNLLAGTAHSGLFHYDTSNGQWQRIADIGSVGIVGIKLNGVGSIVVATRHNGMYILDSGAWKEFNLGLPVKAIHAFAQMQNGTLFIGTADGCWSYYPTSTKWAEAYPPLGSIQHLMAAQGPELYVRTNNAPAYELDGERPTLYRTANHGETFEPIIPGTSSDWVSSVCSDSIGVLHSIAGSTIARSTDGGLHWQQGRVALHDRQGSQIISVGERLLLADGYVPKWSTDGGLTWNTYDFPPSVRFFSANHRGDLYATDGKLIYRSLNGGRTWVRTDASAYNIGELHVLDDGTLVVPSNDTLYYSTDQGATLEKATGAVPYWNAQPSSVGTTAFINCRNGIYKSTDKGMTWTRAISTSFAPNRFVLTPTGCVASDNQWTFRSTNQGIAWDTIKSLPSGIEMLTAVKGNLFAAAKQGVFVSDDEGAHWRLSNAGLHTGGEESIAVSTKGNIFAISDFMLVRSTDHGTTWEDMREDSGYTMLVATPSGTVIAENVANYTGICSTDEGMTWQPCRLVDVPVDIDSNSTIYTYSTYHLASTTDLGQTWNDLPIGSYDVLAAASGQDRHYFAEPKRVVATTSDFKSITKSSVPINGPERGLSHIAVGSNGAVYVATSLSPGLIHRSLDRSLTWQEVFAADSGIKLQDFVLGRDGELYAASGSPYRSIGALSIFVAADSSHEIAGVRSPLACEIRIWPNPVSSVLHIEPVGTDQLRKLEIRDVLGREIALVLPQDTTVRYDVRQLPNGVYFAIATSGDSRTSARFIVSR